MSWEPGDGTGPESGPGVPGGTGPAGSGWAGRDPAPGRGRDGRLAGFAPGGRWDGCRPGPELLSVLAAVGGPGWRCPGAEPDELIGVLRRLAAVESWASAAKLAVVREMIRQDDTNGTRARHGDLPDQWSDSLSHELALALACSVQSADKTAVTAWELGARLPGTAALLADGTLTLAKARLIAETFQWLSDDDAALAEALLLPRLTGATGKTYGQIASLAARIAGQVDPGLAERRRKAAVRHGSRVRMFREESGAAGLSGRELPAGETAAANANVTARAEQYKASGTFPGARTDQLRATAYLDLINGVPGHARIALGQLSTDGPDPDPGPEADGGPDSGGGPGHGGPGHGGPGHGGPGHGGPGHGGPGHGGPGHGGPGGRRPFDGHGPGSARDATDADVPGGSGTSAEHGHGGGSPDRPGDGLGVGEPGGSGAPVLTDLTFPLATLLGLADRPGEAHGLGPLDPALCRELARLAAASAHTRVCVTVTEPDGTAIGHGCGRTAKLAAGPAGNPPVPSPGGAPPPLAALPARLNLTVTVACLTAMLAREAPVGPGQSRPQPPSGWGLTRRDPGRPPGAAGRPGPPDGKGSPGGRGSPHARGSPGDPPWCGAWTLTLPGGRELAVRIEPVPTRDCDHRHESHGYQPNDTLRHLVQVRDHECTFPPCSRHARDSDFEHGRPYDQGGRTCSCNAGARSRRCHRVKQSPGWQVTQPQPGWHQWITPSGRTYTQGPYQYPV